MSIRDRLAFWRPRSEAPLAERLFAFDAVTQPLPVIRARPRRRLRLPGRRSTTPGAAHAGGGTDPALPGLLVMSGTALVGFALIGFSWRAVARTLYPWLQVPSLVSGGLAGLLLLAAGLLLVDIQLDRRDAARHSVELDTILDEVATIVAHAPALRARRRNRTSR
ncbi:MAG TPA: hypothetical protein VNE21_01585 [Mycobacteriales bacterium]|nr:hypothetical protein [Mycobacteriales bacterium]